MPILMGFLALALVFMVLKAYANASPALLARLVRYGGGFAASLGGCDVQPSMSLPAQLPPSAQAPHAALKPQALPALSATA